MPVESTFWFPSARSHWRYAYRRTELFNAKRPPVCRRHVNTDPGVGPKRRQGVTFRVPLTHDAGVVHELLSRRRGGLPPERYPGHGLSPAGRRHGPPSAPSRAPAILPALQF
jgi:hypothetical protein